MLRANASLDVAKKIASKCVWFNYQSADIDWTPTQYSNLNI